MEEKPDFAKMQKCTRKLAALSEQVSRTNASKNRTSSPTSMSLVMAKESHQIKLQEQYT
jgi:hypothetical protein